MIYGLTWLAPVLESVGLKVAEVPGWESRGRSEMGKVLGVLCHHTAGALTGNMPTLDTLINGRSDLPGPLSQLGLGRDGTYYVIAAGLCNHAGVGSWQGVSNRGNSNFIGIEAENTGQANDPWPPVQTEAYQRGVAAILSHLQLPAPACVAHKEYAPGRKFDPCFDMVAFRQAVADITRGVAPALQLIPAAEPQSPGVASRPTLRRGATNNSALVKIVQKTCGVDQDGNFGAGTEAALRALQRSKDLVPDGIVGPKTWRILDAVSAAAQG